MNPIRHIRRIASVLAGLAGLAAALLASGATPAFAKATPGPPQPYPGANLPPAQIHTVTRTVVVGGMPGWQIALIAAAAALLAATVAVLVDRARSAHRQAAMLAA
jgi:hypothetical protein